MSLDQQDRRDRDEQARAATLAARYGTHRPVARLVTLVVVVLVAGASLGWLVWAAWFHSSQPIDADVAGFDVRGPHQVRTTLALRVSDASATGTCLLRASAADHSVVGEQSVPVKGISGRSQRYVDVRTERAATTVEVARCSTD